MCILCDSFKKNELTVVEAWSNYSEMADIMEPEHAREVYMMLVQALADVGPAGILLPPTVEKIKKK